MKNKEASNTQEKQKFPQDVLDVFDNLKLSLGIARPMSFKPKLDNMGRRFKQNKKPSS